MINDAFVYIINHFYLSEMAKVDKFLIKKSEHLHFPSLTEDLRYKLSIDFRENSGYNSPINKGD